MTFGKPPEKNIDWNIWRPLVPVTFQKHINRVILVCGVLAVVATILILRQDVYSSTIYNLVFEEIIYRFIPETTRVSAITFSVAIRLIYIFTIIFFHEYLHIVCYPKIGRTKTYIYIDKKIGAICPLYDGEISRERRLLTNALPLIVLTGGTYLLSFLVDHDFRNILRITALVNFALSYVDIIGIFLLLKLPPKAILYLGVWRK